jgi:hypothetical protein
VLSENSSSDESIRKNLVFPGLHLFTETDDAFIESVVVEDCNE